MSQDAFENNYLASELKTHKQNGSSGPSLEMRSGGHRS